MLKKIILSLARLVLLLLVSYFILLVGYFIGIEGYANSGEKASLWQPCGGSTLDSKECAIGLTCVPTQNGCIGCGGICKLIIGY